MEKIHKAWLRAAATLMVAAAAGACSSGSADEPEAPEEAVGLPVRFSAAPADASSRAPMTATAFAADGTAFAVWGVYRSSDGKTFPLFDATEVKRTAGEWVYSGERLWYPTFTYDFRALYPASGVDASFTAEGNTLSVKDFDATKGIDLMAAAHTRTVNPLSVTVNRPEPQPAVDLGFRHLLSRVTIAGRSDDRYLGSDGTPDGSQRNIVVTSFKISGLATTGSWNGATFAADGSTTGTWTPGAQTATLAADCGTGIPLGNEPTDLFAGDKVIMAIPQSVSGLKVEIVYHYTDGSDGDHTAVTTLNCDWKPGKSYRYNFAVNTHIFFDVPTVEDWTRAPVNDSHMNIDVRK